MKSLFNIVLTITLVSPILFGCKKDVNPNLGKVKYAFTTNLSNPIDLEISYYNEFGEYQTEYVTNTTWSKTLDYSKMEYGAYLEVGDNNNNGEVLPNMTGTLQIYKDGVKQNEVQVQTTTGDQFFWESLSYIW